MSNPTAKQDEENWNLPEEEQYPSGPPRVVTIDTDELDLFGIYPEELDLQYTLLRCKRETHPELADAQSFFNSRRALAVENGCPWRAEGAIFRTARWWAKKVVL